MAKKKPEDLPVNADGATFVPSKYVSFRTSEEALDVAGDFESLAHSRTLRNPRAALNRAHQLLDVAVKLEAQEKGKSG